MDSVTVEGLLRADEEKLRSELRADDMIDGDRALSTERLRNAFGEVLLRYNAAASGDKPRQAMADCLTAAAGDMLGLLQAGTVKRDAEKARVRVGAVVLLLLGVIFALTAALVIRTYLLPGCILAALCPVSTFASGLLWRKQGRETLSAGLDPEVVWRTVRRTGETMDRKIETFCQQLAAWEAERDASAADGESMSPEELQLIADLLEGLYSENGDYSLRQMKKLLPYLQSRGIEIADYDGSDPAAFELLPTKREGRTLRPAIYAGDKLLLPGRAAEHVDETR